MSELVDEIDLKSIAEMHTGSSPVMGIYCPRCMDTKSYDDFSKHPTRKTGVTNWCKSCHTKYSLERKRECRDYLWEIKSQPCVDCGKSYHPYAMDLHHLDPNTKEFQVGKCMSLDKVKKEVSKCIVLCAVCHRLRHIPTD